MSADLVCRFDVASLGKPERTSQGFLRIPAFLTRAGVLQYKRADGTVVRELRPPDEVFGARSLATLSAAPVTDLHPSELITPSNVRRHAVGIVSDAVKPDGDFVSAFVTVQDEATIGAVERGERRELSCGYQCRIDATPGTYNGQAYDQVQRGIVYNHVALGPRNWGRAGRDVALRLDAAGALAVATLEQPPAPPAETHEPDAGGDPAGDEPQGGEPSPQPEPAEAGPRLDDAIAERDAALGRCDALERELGALRAAQADAPSSRTFDARVHERAELLLKARRVLGEAYRGDGLSDREIHLEVLRQLEPGTDHAREDSAYVCGRFDVLLAGHGTRNDALDHARRVTAQRSGAPAQRRDDGKPYVPPWRQHLSVSKHRLQHGDER